MSERPVTEVSICQESRYFWLASSQEICFGDSSTVLAMLAILVKNDYSALFFKFCHRNMPRKHKKEYEPRSIWKL